MVLDSTIIVAIITGSVTLINILVSTLTTSAARKTAAKTATDQGQDKKLALLEEGLQALLRAEIIRSHDKYIEEGYCPIYAKEALTRCYNAYHALGGNDVATQLYQQCIYLPDKPKQ